MWNKIYKNTVVKKAFQKVDDFYLNMCEDMYLYFLIAWYADSYFGITDKFYHYNYGRGITGGRKYYNYDSFDKLCQMSLIVPKLSSFLNNKNEFEKYKDIFRCYEQRLYISLFRWTL